MAKMNTTEIYQMVTDQMIEALESGTIPWQKPWRGGGGLGGMPTSLSSGNPYRGINTLILWLKGYGCLFWGTFNRIKKMGGKIRKGEKATKVIFWQFIEKEDKKTGKMETIPFLKTFNVFNADQADWPEGEKPGAVALPPGAELDFKPLDEAERVIEEYLAADGPTLRGDAGRAAYHPGTDEIQMPAKASFVSVEEWYSTVFHELVHSTGAKKRLAREGIAEVHHFGDPIYSREELIAEMGSAFLCVIVGIDATDVFQNSAAYIAGWLKKIKEEPRLVVTAAGRAQKAVDLILGTKREEG